MPSSEACIVYIFSRTFGIAQGYIVLKIKAKYYQGWTDIFQDLKNAFSNPDPEFYV